MPALDLAQMARNATVDAIKSKPPLIKHIDCLYPDFHVLRRREANIPSCG
jgi:hypothetical protein